jgi:hypothetical protein
MRAAVLLCPSDGYDIFKRAAEFDADHIFVGIKAQRVAGELALEMRRQRVIGRSDGDRGRRPGGDLLCEGRPAERCDRQLERMRRKHLSDHLCHAQAAFILDALAGADHHLPAAQMRRKGFERTAHVMRRHDGDDNFGRGKSLGRIGDGAKSGRQWKTRQKDGVLTALAKHRGDFFGVSPERDLVAAAPGEAQGNGGAPGTASHDGNAAHAALAFEDLPKRYSVPLSRRRMFWWCLTITISGMRTMTASSQRLRGGCGSRNAKTGNAMAARIEPSET